MFLFDTVCIFYRIIALSEAIYVYFNLKFKNIKNHFNLLNKKIYEEIHKEQVDEDGWTKRTFFLLARKL